MSGIPLHDACGCEGSLLQLAAVHGLKKHPGTDWPLGNPPKSHYWHPAPGWRSLRNNPILRLVFPSSANHPGLPMASSAQSSHWLSHWCQHCPASFTLDLVVVLVEYRDFFQVFSKTKATSLPPHWLVHRPSAQVLATSGTALLFVQAWTGSHGDLYQWLSCHWNKSIFIPSQSWLLHQEERFVETLFNNRQLNQSLYKLYKLYNNLQWNWIQTERKKHWLYHRRMFKTRFFDGEHSTTHKHNVWIWRRSALPFLYALVKHYD